MQVRIHFGRNLEHLTQGHGARRALADTVGISNQQLTNIINGTGVKGCGLDTAYTIARVLGVTLDEMCLPHMDFRKLRKVKKILKNQELLASSN